MQADVRQHSTHFDTISNFNLSPAQAQVVAALAQGRSVSAAAREASVHRATIHNWFHDESGFKAAVQNARREYVVTLDDQVRDLSGRAFQTLRDLLEDPKTPAAVRLKAALAVLQRPQYPDQAWRLPESIESLDEEEVLDGVTELEAGDCAMRVEPAPAQTARNAPCPCGSGRKYKRCCAGRVSSPAAQPLSSTAHAGSS